MAFIDKARVTLALTIAGVMVALFVVIPEAAAAAPPEGRITATLAHPVTTYTAEVTDPDGDPLTYTWSAEIDCGTFRGSTPQPQQAQWEHPDGQPPSGCSHQSQDHPGNIEVVVADGTGYEVTCFYLGSEPGQGDPCVLSRTPGETTPPSSTSTTSPSASTSTLPPTTSPSATSTTTSSPSPTETEGPSCGRHGTAGMPHIVGGPDDDVLEGTAAAEVICGRGGHDTIRGGAGNDILLGGSGKDEIAGGRGNDVIRGGGGADNLTGNDGNDTIQGGGGPDQLFGNDGEDRLKGGAAADFIKGGPDKDRLDGGPGRPDFCNGGGGRDRISDRCELSR